MTDRELLELAARAAEIYNRKYLDGEFRQGILITGFYCPLMEEVWNPLTDDGDALRLAVMLGISIVPYPIYNAEKHSVTTKQRRRSDLMREPNPTETIERYGNYPLAATRRAIVRTAAEIGKLLK